MKRTPIASPALIYTARPMIAPCSTPPTLPTRNSCTPTYLKTWAMLGIEPTPRERALALIPERTEVLTRRREPTTPLASQVTSAYRAGNNRSRRFLRGVHAKSWHRA